MARTYSVRIAALATGVPVKWLDNLLSRHDVPGVARTRRGVERSVSDIGLLAVEACRILNLELGVSMQRAVEIVESALTQPGDELTFVTPSGLSLHLPLEARRQRLRHRILEAVETAPRSARGRPVRQRRSES